MRARRSDLVAGVGSRRIRSGASDNPQRSNLDHGPLNNARARVGRSFRGRVVGAGLKSG